MTSRPQNSLQGSLFEEDYLLRTLGPIAHQPDVALTELVANAWDAGASTVKITIPETTNENLVVADDGSGMTPRQFDERWMTLAYNRLRHQGNQAEFPPDRHSWTRPAYGRNGVGRHGLLCFGSKYSVETKRGNTGSRYTIATSSRESPFVIVDKSVFESRGHGTILRVKVERNLPDPEKIRDVLASRFLHDPMFVVSVNGKSVPLEEHVGLVDRRVLVINHNVTVEVFFIDSTKAARTNQHQGIAFWVGKRLVGTPSWSLGDRTVIDGRTQLAKRHTVVVKSDDIFDEVLPDWSGFRRSSIIEQVYDIVAEYVENRFRELARSRVSDTKASVIRANRHEIGKLKPLARMEVSEFIDELMVRSPLASAETVTLAVQAVIHLEQTRSGSALLEKLAVLPESDIEGLDRLLTEWTVRDALTVLDEIDRRINIVEALDKLSKDHCADELHTLHPLVTNARWLFGPEFDSSEYTSNTTLRTAVAKVFHKQATGEEFINHRKRPDLLILEDATLSAVATEQIDPDSNLATMRDVLLIEIKKGDSTIGREEMNQANGYVEDLLTCGLLDGPPYIRAFVVGHELSPHIEPIRSMGSHSQRGRIQAATYSQLVRTAHQRLFRLRDQLTHRYEDISGDDILNRILSEPEQVEADFT